MADRVIFVPDVAAQQREFRSWNGMVGRWLKGVTVRATATAKLEAPAPGRTPRNRTGLNYATGELAISGITYTLGRHNKELEGRVVAIPEHAVFLHGGTKPHAIKPVRAKMLKFHWKALGKTVHSRGVMHPGTIPNDFLMRGVKKAL